MGMASMNRQAHSDRGYEGIVLINEATSLRTEGASAKADRARRGSCSSWCRQQGTTRRGFPTAWISVRGSCCYMYSSSTDVSCELPGATGVSAKPPGDGPAWRGTINGAGCLGLRAGVGVS